MSAVSERFQAHCGIRSDLSAISQSQYNSTASLRRIATFAVMRPRRMAR